MPHAAKLALSATSANAAQCLRGVIAPPVLSAKALPTLDPGELAAALLMVRGRQRHAPISLRRVAEIDPSGRRTAMMRPCVNAS